jgi:DNA-binding response OmpR family regulator
VLAVGFDPWLFEAQRPVWRSAGYFVTSVRSTQEAVEHLDGGDFDLVLFSESMHPEISKHLTASIRASGSLVPVASLNMKDLQAHMVGSVHLVNKSEPSELLQRIERLVTSATRWPSLLPALAS